MIKEYGDWKRGTVNVESDKDGVYIEYCGESIYLPMDFWKEIVKDFKVKEKVGV